MNFALNCIDNSRRHFSYFMANKVFIKQKIDTLNFSCSAVLEPRNSDAPIEGFISTPLVQGESVVQYFNTCLVKLTF